MIIGVLSLTLFTVTVTMANPDKGLAASSRAITCMENRNQTRVEFDVTKITATVKLS